MLGNILLQAIHHVLQLEATKLATKSQWTGHIINIEEVCFGVVHPITKQTITQYCKLQHDPNLKDLWVPAMSKELHRLAQGKPDIIKATNTIFSFLTMKYATSPKTKQLHMLIPLSNIGHKNKIPTAYASLWVGTSFTTPLS
jgi:hypothetical protein